MLLNLEIDIRASRNALFIFAFLYGSAFLALSVCLIRQSMSPFLGLFLLSILLGMSYENLMNHALRRSKKSITQLIYQANTQKIIIKNNLGEVWIKNNFTAKWYNSHVVLLDLNERGLLQRNLIIFRDACNRDSFRRLHILIRESQLKIGEARGKTSKRRKAINQTSEKWQSRSL